MSYFAHVAGAGCSENDDVYLNASLYNGNLSNKIFVNGEQFATFGVSYSHSFPGDQHYNFTVVAEDWPTIPLSAGPCVEPTTTTSTTVPETSTTTSTTIPETTSTSVPESTTTVPETTVVETTTSAPGTTTPERSTTTTDSVPAKTVVTQTTVPPRPGLPETGAIYEPFLFIAPVAIMVGWLMKRVMKRA